MSKTQASGWCCGVRPHPSYDELNAESLIEPAELAVALDADPQTRARWETLSRSVRKQALSWIAIAKRAETRDRRIADIAARVARGESPL